MLPPRVSDAHFTSGNPTAATVAPRGDPAIGAEVGPFCHRFDDSP
jgi:hypothetical protein